MRVSAEDADELHVIGEFVAVIVRGAEGRFVVQTHNPGVTISKVSLENRKLPGEGNEGHNPGSVSLPFGRDKWHFRGTRWLRGVGGVCLCF